ncbi:hypothetical protein [Parasegetibacter sp. NRK P23]|uniref:hypothetical protein n=1 Tax=Parasegetibacter sp. NRK P23 TaxID=2942999 RepID=UPI002043E6A7|nr:hypothetical protein [Parasegetibacter sp. NRK P23]MCM5529053.1 hypothetical protein [Parasegetibacter sp. NRK P23]
MTNFLYCHDPLDENVGEYLLHIQDPNALIKVIALEEEAPVESDEFVSKIYEFAFDEDEVEEYQLIFTPIGSRSQLVPASTEDEKLAVLDAAWEYWVGIMEQEGEEYDEDISF